MALADAIKATQERRSSGTPLDESSVAPEGVSLLSPSAAAVGDSSSGDPEQESSVTEAAAKDTPASSDSEPPFGVAETVTPSGIEIYFQAGPKRLYRIRDINIADSQRTPLTDWIEVASMSETLDILDKPALPFWGQRIGVRAILELIERGLLKWVP